MFRPKGMFNDYLPRIVLRRGDVGADRMTASSGGSESIMCL